MRDCKLICATRRHFREHVGAIGCGEDNKCGSCLMTGVVWQVVLVVAAMVTVVVADQHRTARPPMFLNTTPCKELRPLAKQMLAEKKEVLDFCVYRKFASLYVHCSNHGDAPEPALVFAKFIKV